MPNVTWTQVAAWRMRQHQLEKRAPAEAMLDIASRLCGLQAQVMSSAELTVWARVEGLERGAVQRALWEHRTLVKTWAMRGTLHLLPADEMPLWHAALRTNPRYLRPLAWRNYFGITLEELDQLTKAVGVVLKRRVMTREELMREVVKLTGSSAFGTKLAQSSWGTILKPAALTGRLCFGPSLGQRVRFTHPQSWLAGKRRAGSRSANSKMDAASATAAVTRRFLRVYGPATCHDLARWWGGGGVANARKWIAALGPEVCTIELDGVPHWMLAADVKELSGFERGRCVRLVPGFDQYVIGASRHAEHLLPEGLRNRVYRPQGWISPVLLVNGRMEGIWRHKISGSRLEVEIEPFVKVPAWVRRAGSQEAERLGAFFGCKLDLSWAT